MCRPSDRRVRSAAFGEEVVARFVRRRILATAVRDVVSRFALMV